MPKLPGGNGAWRPWAIALGAPALTAASVWFWPSLQGGAGLLYGGAAALAAWRFSQGPFIACAASGLAFQVLHAASGGAWLPQGAAFASLALAGAGMLALKKKLRHERARRMRMEARSADMEHGEDDARAERQRVAGESERHLNLLVALARRAMAAHSAVLLEAPAAALEQGFRVRAWEGEDIKLEAEARVPVEAFPLRRVLAGEAFVSGPRDKPFEAWPGFAQAPPFHSVAAASVDLGTGKAGVLAFFHPEPQAFAGAAREMLKRWAAHVAESLALWRRVARGEESARELRILQEGMRRMAALTGREEVARALLELVRGVAACDAAAVCLWSGAEPLPYRVFAAQEDSFLTWEDAKTPNSWARWIYEHAEEAVAMGSVPPSSGAMPLYSLQESRERFRSFAGLPLASAKRRFGALMAGRHEEEAFDAHSMQVLSVLASHAGLALDAAEMYERMEEMAVTDGLTGLYNHRRFRQALEEELRRCERTGGIFSVLLMDLDHFKRVNDTLGHPAGDAVLRHAAAVLEKQMRGSDLLARYGGEEFAALLVGSGPAEAVRSAERLRAALEASPARHEGREIAVTLSLGAASYPENGRQAAALLRQVDEALYASKRAGRNRGTHASLLRGGTGAWK